MEYYVNLGIKLSNYDTGSKYFWTALKRLVNNKKLTNIPPILEDGKIISDFHLKSNIFNNYFANQCSPNNTSSVLTPFQIDTMSRIDSINTSEDKIANIILKLNSKKPHGYDDISIAMLKLCAPAVSKPLNLIFKKCLNEGVFPKAWKFANVQPIIKK